MSHEPGKLTLLGTSGVSQPTELLESFEKPEGIQEVVMISDEMTALCEKTHQPDQYTVEIHYIPDRYCIESKSLKLELQKYRIIGCFCERLATQIAKHVMASINPFSVRVTMIQKPRGGIAIRATAAIVRT